MARLHPQLGEAPPGENEDKEAWLSEMREKHGDEIAVTPSREFAAKFAKDKPQERVAEPAGVSSR